MVEVRVEHNIRDNDYRVYMNVDGLAAVTSWVSSPEEAQAEALERLTETVADERPDSQAQDQEYVEYPGALGLPDDKVDNLVTKVEEI